MSKERIIITGATRGIGYATANSLLSLGAVVGVNYIKSENIALDLQEKYPDRCIPLQFDVTNPKRVSHGIQHFVEKAGGIDVLINNAGILIPRLLTRISDESIFTQIATNLFGPIYCTREVIPFMLREKQGLIINIGSVASDKPNAGQSIYAATKGGLESFTRAVAVEYASRNIRAVCISAGPIDTDLLRPTIERDQNTIIDRMPVKRLGTPQEIADLISYLISSKASFFNASILSLDGGYGSI